MKFAVVLTVAALCFLAMAADCGAQGQGGPKCPEVCTADFSPVCAIRRGYRRTFGNDCELERFNCNNRKQQYVKVSDCACIP